MKRLPLVLLFCCLVLCLLLAGCKNNGSSSGTTIRGQIVINGEPARPDQAIHTVEANGKTYADLVKIDGELVISCVISENGYFSHGSGSLDHEYCQPGSVVTLIFEPTAKATGAFSKTHVYEYVVKKGDNNLGQIDLGLNGFGLESPEEGAEVGAESWPPKFIWNAYERTGVTPEYRLSLGCNPLVAIEKTTKDTSVTLDGDETVTTLFYKYGLEDVKNWTVHVEYQEGSHRVHHYSSETRNIKLTPPTTPED